MRALIAIALTLLAVLAAPASGKAPPPPEQTAVVGTGRAPCGIAARAGSIWIGVYESGKLLQLDDRTGRRESSVSVGRWACRVAVGPGAIWVARDRPGELVRVSRGSGRIRRMLIGTGAFDILLAGRWAWATTYDHGYIVQIDAARFEMTRIFADGPKPAGVTWCGGRIWVGHGGTTTWLTRIDPASHAMRRVRVGTRNPGWPRCIRNALWVTAGGTLLKADARTGKVLARLDLGGTLAEAREGPDGLIWVTDKERSLVHRVSAGDATPSDSFSAGPGAYALARVEDAMWITSFAGDDVRRFER